MDRADLVVAQSIGVGEVADLIAVDVANALEMAAEPEVAVAVLENRAHAAVDGAVWPRFVGQRQSLRRGGLVAQGIIAGVVLDDGRVTRASSADRYHKQ